MDHNVNLKRVRVEANSPRKKQSLPPPPHKTPLAAHAAAASAAAATPPTGATSPITPVQPTKASTSPSAYPQRGQPALTPQQTLPTIPELHEAAAEHQAGDTCPWPFAAAAAAAATRSADGRGAVAIMDEGAAAQQQRQQQTGPTAAPSGGSAGVSATAAAGEASRLPLPMPPPCAIPTASLCLPSRQAAHVYAQQQQQQQLHAAWATVQHSGQSLPGPQMHHHHYQLQHQPPSDDSASSGRAAHWQQQQQQRLQEHEVWLRRTKRSLAGSEQHPAPLGTGAGRARYAAVCAWPQLCLAPAGRAHRTHMPLEQQQQWLEEADPMATDECHYRCSPPAGAEEALCQLATAFDAAMAAAAGDPTASQILLSRRQREPSLPIDFLGPAATSFGYSGSSGSSGSSDSISSSSDSSDSMEE